MPKFWVSIHHPEGFDASVSEGEEIRAEIDALNNEMVAAGVRVFVGGLHLPSEAISVTSGGAVVEPGRYLETNEYVGGFWVLELDSMETAIE